MPEILRINRPADYASYVGADAPHPLVAVIDYASLSPIRHSLNSYGVYGLFVQENNDLELTYGCGKYDFRDGSIICVAPGQIGGKENNGSTVSIGGWALLFHPDLLRFASLSEEIKSCTFFDYRINEALHMNEEEHSRVVELLKQIHNETRRPSEPLCNEILGSYISLLLTICKRLFIRQFSGRHIADDDILKKFYHLLHSYFAGGLQSSLELPTVSYCARELCMSPNYFSDTIKRNTGFNASHFIRHFIIGMAKNELAAGHSVAETAYSLGFDYPQHLSRVFKKETGMTPSLYVSSLKGFSRQDQNTQ